jgi:GTPase SAR1 family protein
VDNFNQTTELVLDGRILSLDIVDTTGYYSFPAVKDLGIHTADAFVLVFNVNEEDSFQHISALRDLICQIKCNATHPADIPIVVVGNKLDIDARSVVERITMECIVAIDWEHPYVETSAMSNCNIHAVIDKLIEFFNIPGFTKTTAKESHRSGRKSVY